MIDDYRIYVNNFNVHPFYVQLRFHIIIYGISLLFPPSKCCVVCVYVCVCVGREKGKITQPYDNWNFMLKEKESQECFIVWELRDEKKNQAKILLYMIMI